MSSACNGDAVASSPTAPAAASGHRCVCHSRISRHPGYGAALPCASAAVRRAAATSEMDLIFIAVSHLVHAPLIDCGCRQTFLHPSQAGCATNARWRAAPQSPQERYVAIVMSDAARRRRVRKFVAGRPAPIAQRRANACASFGRQHMPARYDSLTRLRTARSDWSWHPLLALRR
jgi:hypothetical protein